QTTENSCHLLTNKRKILSSSHRTADDATYTTCTTGIDNATQGSAVLVNDTIQSTHHLSTYDECLLHHWSQVALYLRWQHLKSVLYHITGVVEPACQVGIKLKTCILELTRYCRSTAGYTTSNGGHHARGVAVHITVKNGEQ